MLASVTAYRFLMLGLSLVLLAMALILVWRGGRITELLHLEAAPVATTVAASARRA